MVRTRALSGWPALALAAMVPLAACGGNSAPPPSTAAAPKAASSVASAAAAPPKLGYQAHKEDHHETHKCADTDAKHQTYDLHDETPDHHFAPCSGGGAHDYSALIRFEALDHGVRVHIKARDDEVSLLGPDVKERDRVMVHPKTPTGEAVAIEVPLTHITGGYVGEKIIYWEELHKLTDEGTRLEISIYDHDAKGSHEEMKISVALSTGKSCEKAADENPQQIVMGKKNARPDLTAAELGKPMQSSAFMASCGLDAKANAEICAAVKNGKPLGVSVKVAPANNRVAACIDRAVRRLSFPDSDKLDVVKTRF